MTQSVQAGWPGLINGEPRAQLADFAPSYRGEVDTVFLTTSHTRGSRNPARPNVTVYFIAISDRAARVHLALRQVHAKVRRDLIHEYVDIAIECHRCTVGQRGAERIDGQGCDRHPRRISRRTNGSRYQGCGK